MTIQACVNAQAPVSAWLCLGVDITNAFNTVNRDSINNSLQTRAPHLVPWAQKMLGQATIFLCGSRFIRGESSAQQGDPLDPSFSRWLCSQ
jgi:hypothetical protein